MEAANIKMRKQLKSFKIPPPKNKDQTRSNEKNLEQTFQNEPVSTGTLCKTADLKKRKPFKKPVADKDSKVIS